MVAVSEMGPIEPVAPFAHGIFGDRECAHAKVRFYHSAFQEDSESGLTGIYSVCLSCGWHVWNAQPPRGAEVVDLDTWEDDEDEEQPS